MNGIERERTSSILVIFIQYCFDIVMSIFSIYYEICKCLIPLMYWAMYDAFGGKKCIPYRYVINSQKCGTFFFVLLLMIIYNNYSLTMWLYVFLFHNHMLIVLLALHGTYGFVWFFKDVVFPDKAFQQKCTIGSAILTYVIILFPYWLAPYLIASGRTTEPSYAQIWLSITLYTLGTVIMMVSDAQKYYVLQIQKGLITNGMFAYVRHPNYLGEMMIYLSFALLANHILPYLILLYVWIGVFGTRIVSKEISMSRYPEWNNYVERTNYLIPIKGIKRWLSSSTAEKEE